MLRLALLLYVMSSVLMAYAANCPSAEQPLKVTYEITKTNVNSAKRHTTELMIWREQGRVAHQYPATQITEVWERPAHGMIKPTRYFDHHHRAIEYQPGESVHGKVEQDWSYRYQLVSETLLSKMTLAESTGSDCELKQTLTLSDKRQSISVTWWPNKKLVESLSLDNGHIQETWTLRDQQIDPSSLASFFATRAAYQSTDFADIGDDHSDPFLTNMVNLGFIEAGASGFYDQHGNAIGEHSH